MAKPKRSDEVEEVKTDFENEIPPEEASGQESSAAIGGQREPETKPTLIMTELDSIIHERLKAQPKSLKELDLQVSRTEAPGLHRLSLPEYFEKFSYDCTRGEICEVHRKNGKDVKGRGKYIMRWILKDKRAIDYAINVRGWMLVNKVLFHDAPNILFSTSGAVENGDSLLAVMPVEKALKIREFPRVRSQELLRSRMTPSKTKANRVLMTGNPESEYVYEPDMGTDEADTGEGSASQPGSIQEGRDF